MREIEFNVMVFVASEGWLCNFFRRNGITLHCKTTISQQVSETAVPTLTSYLLFVCVKKNNNNNNYKISIVPISSKSIKLSGTPSTGFGKTHSAGMMQSSSTMIKWQGNLGGISESKKVSFQMVTERNYAI